MTRFHPMFGKLTLPCGLQSLTFDARLSRLLQLALPCGLQSLTRVSAEINAFGEAFACVRCIQLFFLASCLHAAQRTREANVSCKLFFLGRHLSLTLGYVHPQKVVTPRCVHGNLRPTRPSGRWRVLASLKLSRSPYLVHAEV